MKSYNMQARMIHTLQEGTGIPAGPLQMAHLDLQVDPGDRPADRQQADLGDLQAERLDRREDLGDHPADRRQADLGDLQAGHPDRHTDRHPVQHWKLLDPHRCLNE